MTDTCTIVLERVEKSYAPGGFHLGPIDLVVPAGQTIAVLGKNGAGKSTLFQAMTGNHDVTSGTITLGGERMTRQAFGLKRRLGYLPQHMDLPRWVSGLEILTYAARLYEIPRPQDAITAATEQWDFGSFAHIPLQACSYGMQKRIGLALATFHDPMIVILDEPFSGLDLFHIKALEDAILARHDAGRVTILSTHVASYAAKLCHEAYIIESGKMRRMSGWSELGQYERIAALEQEFFGNQMPKGTT